MFLSAPPRVSLLHLTALQTTVGRRNLSWWKRVTGPLRYPPPSSSPPTSSLDTPVPPPSPPSPPPSSSSSSSNKQKSLSQEDLRKIIQQKKEQEQEKTKPRQVKQQKAIQGVKRVLAVASGKGGVGKSTVSVNIASSLSSRMGLKVGLLDLDVYGPSIPKMMGLPIRKPEISKSNKMIPITSHGIQCMSFGLLVSEEAPIIWRGLRVMALVEQLLHQVEWNDLDVLVLDLPPGTGDTQLTLAQSVDISGVVLVSTPQDVAWADAVRGANLFKELKIPIIGLVENMNSFLCTSCNTSHSIFNGQSTITDHAKKAGVKVIGGIPLVPDVTSTSDKGTPISIASPESEPAKAFFKVSEEIVKGLGI